MNSFR